MAVLSLDRHPPPTDPGESGYANHRVQCTPLWMQRAVILLSHFAFCNLSKTVIWLSQGLSFHPSGRALVTLTQFCDIIAEGSWRRVTTKCVTGNFKSFSWNPSSHLWFCAFTPIIHVISKVVCVPVNLGSVGKRRQEENVEVNIGKDSIFAWRHTTRNCGGWNLDWGNLIHNFCLSPAQVSHRELHWNGSGTRE